MVSTTTQDYEKMTLEALEALVLEKGEAVRSMKAQNMPKEALASHIDELKQIKQAKEKLEALEEAEKKKNTFDRATFESIMLKRFFFAPSFQIYGGVAGLFDYGPPMCGLQSNFLNLWRQHFVLEEDMLEIECTNITPESVFQTSGHVERFADYMVRDKVTGEIFRADHLVKAVLKARLEGVDTSKKLKKGEKLPPLSPQVREEYETILEQLDNYQGDALHQLMIKLDIRAPETGNEVTEPKLFNLMFQTEIGPTGQFKGYLRPETAQGHFVNFKKLLEFNTDQMPFASAMIGKSFRNEISPRQGLLRVREFTMSEIEHYVDPLKKQHKRFNEVRGLVIPLYSAKRQLEAAGPELMDIGKAVDTGVVNNETLGYFIARIYLFLKRIGINPQRMRFRQHMENEMAHYACDCWDCEIESSYGWIECVGCADRSAYDLTAHAKRTKEKLVVREALPEPIIKECLVLELNKKVFGAHFRGAAKIVTAAIEDWKLNDEDWDEDKLAAAKASLEANGKFTVKGSDGNTYELDSNMVTIEKQTIKKSVREFIPNVIEPSFGIGRILYSLLEHSYYVREGDEQRAVLSFPPVVAPTKALIVPISRNDAFESFITQLSTGLRKRGISSKVDNSTGSIGKRYARNDELGTPFAVTIDFQTVKDATVTLRERDSTRQIREKMDTILDIIKDLVDEKTTWPEVAAKYPAFTAQEVSSLE